MTMDAFIYGSPRMVLLLRDRRAQRDGLQGKLRDAISTEGKTLSRLCEEFPDVSREKIRNALAAMFARGKVSRSGGAAQLRLEARMSGPMRAFDWCAYRDPEPGNLYGYGRTEAEAIKDLLEQEEDRCPVSPLGCLQLPPCRGECERQDSDLVEGT